MIWGIFWLGTLVQKKMRKRKNGINKIETCLPITRFISIKFENI